MNLVIGAALDTNGCSHSSKLGLRLDRDDLALHSTKNVTSILGSSLRARTITVRVLQNEHVVTKSRHFGEHPPISDCMDGERSWRTLFLRSCSKSTDNYAGLAQA